jgi:hypothetical protein
MPFRYQLFDAVLQVQLVVSVAAKQLGACLEGMKVGREEIKMEAW